MRLSLPAILISTVLISPALKAEEKLQSPYFIDGVHCEGLDSVETNEDLTIAYPDEVVEVGRKARLQERCESIFADGGVKVFQWVTPADLERATFILIHSKRFKGIDFRIEKSELQNHIHLIGRFEVFEPKPYFHFSLSQGYENDKNHDERLTTKSEGSVHFERRGTVNPAPFVLGYKYFSSTADRPKTLNLAADDDDNTTLNDKERIAIDRPKGRYGAIFAKFQQANGVFLGFQIDTSHLSGDSHETINSRAEAGTEFHLDPLSPSLTRLSVLYANYSAKGTDFYSGKFSNRNSRSIAFAGIHQDIRSRWVKGRANIYRSLTPELHVFGDADIAVSLGTFLTLSHSFGISGEYLRGAILPEHRFGLPDRNVVQYYYRTEKNLGSGPRDQLVSLKLGAATYQAVNQLDRPYFEDQGFAELAWTSVGSNFDTSFALIYGNRRLY